MRADDACVSCKLRPGTDPALRRSLRISEGKEALMSAQVRKVVGAASLILGLIAWLGEKFGLITRQAADWANFGSAVAGLVATFA
jgi:hypothetical protein